MRAVTVYVETNFVLQVACRQEQSAACEEILRRAVTGSIDLAVPVVSLAESVMATDKRHTAREAARAAIGDHLKELGRGDSTAADLKGRIDSLVTGSVQQEDERLRIVQDELTAHARIIGLSATAFLEARELSRFDLERFDSLVLASVLSDLRARQPLEAVFVSTDQGFGVPPVRQELARLRCKWINSFGNVITRLDAGGATGDANYDRG